MLWKKIKQSSGIEDGWSVYVMGWGSDIGALLGSWSQNKGPRLELVFNTLSTLLHPASIYTLSAQGRGPLPRVAPTGSVCTWGSGCEGLERRGPCTCSTFVGSFQLSVVLWQKLLVTLGQMMVAAWKLPWGPSVFPGRRQPASVLVPPTRTPSRHCLVPSES